MPAAKVEPLKLTAAQQKAQSELATPEKTAVALTALSLEYAALQAKATRTPEEDARLKVLDASIEQATERLSDFFKKTLYPELAQKTGTQDANALTEQREVGGEPAAEHAGGAGAACDWHTAAARRGACVCDRGDGAGAQEV